LASDGCRHAEEWIVRINRTERADLLHVIGAPADNCARSKEALEGLKPPKPLAAELLQQGLRVQGEPSGVDVENDADFGQLLDNVRGQEIRVRDARTTVANWHLAGEFLVHFEERLHRAITDGVGRDLQSGLKR